MFILKKCKAFLLELKQQILCTIGQETSSFIISLTSERCAINFRWGPKGDLSFHFNPRFDNGAVIRNSLINGAWGAEENSGAFPFQRVAPFTIEITCQDNAFQVKFNFFKFGNFELSCIFELFFFDNTQWKRAVFKNI